jgi:hypothetical protein
MFILKNNIKKYPDLRSSEVPKGTSNFKRDCEANFACLLAKNLRRFFPPPMAMGGKKIPDKFPVCHSLPKTAKGYCGLFAYGEIRSF